MGNRTRHERNQHRLDKIITVPMEGTAVEKLDKLAKRRDLTRSEYVREIIMAVVEPTVEGAT